MRSTGSTLKMSFSRRDIIGVIGDGEMRKIRVYGGKV